MSGIKITDIGQKVRIHVRVHTRTQYEL